MKNPEIKSCQSCKNQFQIESEDFDFYKKMNVPPPTFCPECREIRRIAFRNERSLYKRKCDLCGSMVISRVSPDKPYPMYCRDCWWGESWDPLKYGREYDFSKPFFAQFKNLLFSVPSISIFNGNMVNSDWVNQETDDKNCYLNVGGHFNEDSAYNTYEFKSRECFDNFWLMSGDLCYENITCERGYKVAFSRDCNDCRDVYLSSDCRNCTNCFGCAGLRNKEFYIWNEPKTKEEFDTFMATRPLASYVRLKEYLKKAETIWNSVPHRAVYVIKSANVSGNYIVGSNNCQHVWNCEDSENSRYHYIIAGLKECFDGSSFGWGELCYECSSSVGLYNCKATMFAFGGGGAETMHSSNLEYSHSMHSCHNCFGCVGLRNKEYCILNKQYTKEEYEALVPKIIAHMNDMPYIDARECSYVYGDSFPVEISNYGYNETVAQDYYPLTREEAIQRGYSWCEYKAETSHAISEYEIPDDIHDVSDDILEKILQCNAGGKPYRLVPMELSFYRKMNIAIPRVSPLERHNIRMKKLLPRHLFSRVCECNTSTKGYTNVSPHTHGNAPCEKEMKTGYAPDRRELVYCEECYQQEIA